MNNKKYESPGLLPSAGFNLKTKQRSFRVRIRFYLYGLHDCVLINRFCTFAGFQGFSLRVLYLRLLN